MNFQEILKISGALLGSLGGGVIIVFAFSNWLGRVWANRLMTKEKAEYAQELESLKNRFTQDTESYKIKLKKSEFIFEKEYEATSEFISFKNNLLPRYKHPDMDWEDVFRHIEGQFKEIEIFLDKFLAQHGAVLSEEVKNDIGHAKRIAGSEKFPSHDEHYPEYPDDKLGEAEEIYDCLVKVEKNLLKHIHSQSST